METPGEPRLCASVERAFELLSRKWLGLIVHILAQGELFFSDLERELPRVSARMLATRIRELETDGLVVRTVHATSPVRVSYKLTPRGMALVPAMESMAAWARAWDRDTAPPPARRSPARAPASARPRSGVR